MRTKLSRSRTNIPANQPISLDGPKMVLVCPYFPYPRTDNNIHEIRIQSTSSKLDMQVVETYDKLMIYDKVRNSAFKN